MADQTKGAEGFGKAPTIATPAEVKIARLKAAVGRERARGRAGHWTYDLARHLSLAKQLKDAERALRAKQPGAP